MAQISVNLDADTEQKLNSWCKNTGLSKVKTFNIALIQFFRSSESKALLKALGSKEAIEALEKNELEEFQF
jgi:hypothetical protein